MKIKTTLPKTEKASLYTREALNSIIHKLQYWSIFKAQDTAFHYLDNELNISQSTSFSDLYKSTQRCSDYLKKQPHYKKKQRALLIFNNSIDFITAFLACITAGMIPVPVYAPKNNHHMERLNAIIENADADYILSHQNHYKKIKSNAHIFNHLSESNIIDIQQILDSPQETNTLRNNSLQEIAFLQYTSGSTGSPKGVMVSQENILANCQQIHDNGHFSTESRIISWLPNYHDMGLISGFLLGINTGCTTYILTTATFFNQPLSWLYAIDKYKITHSPAPNFAYKLCAEKGKSLDKNTDLDLSSWKAAYNAAEPVDPETLKAFNTVFKTFNFNPNTHHPCYGLAESTLMVTSKPYKTLPKKETVLKSGIENREVITTTINTNKSVTFISSGTQGPKTDVLIVNPVTKKALPSHKIGEIWVSSPSVAIGYWENNLQTKQTFLCINNKHYLRTGDLGFLRDDGELFITGRLKDLIIINGRNLFPHDIEKTIETSSTSCVNDGSILFQDNNNCIAIIEITRNAIKNENLPSLKALIQKNVQTNHDVYLSDLQFTLPFSNPKTSSGKKQRHTSLKKHQENSYKYIQSTPKETPNKKSQSETEDLLIHIIKDLTTTQEIPSTASIYDLGINSLMTFQILSRIKTSFYIDITPTDFLNSNTISDIATVIDNKQLEIIHSMIS